MKLDKDTLNLIKAKVNDIVRQRGLDLVDFKVFLQGSRWVIRNIVDYPSGGVTLDECSALNRLIFSAIDKDDVFGDNFVVEVNSPGLDKPLKEPRDFLRARGNIVCIWFDEPFIEKTYVEAEICDVREDSFVAKVKEEIIEIPFNIIRTAKQKI